MNEIIDNLESRIISSDTLKAGKNEAVNLEIINYLDPSHWKVEVVVPWRAAEEILPQFEEIFQHKINVNEYRDYLENIKTNSSTIPPSVKKAKNIISTIAVSSSEPERGYSDMNFICNDKRNRLTVENIFNILTICLIGLPFQEWDPLPFVKIGTSQVII